MTADMDDARGGRRGRRAVVSAQLLELLRSAYGIDGSQARDLGGSSNLNLLVEGRWVVRVYRPYVGRDRIEAIDAARRLLARGSVPCADVRPTLAGAPWTTFGDRCLQVERFVAADAQMNSWGRVRAALPVLGRIHALFRGVDLGQAANEPEFANHVGPDEAVTWAARASERVLGWQPTPAEAQLAEQLLELARRVSVAELSAGACALPRQLVHGDFWDNNVLFRRGRVTLVTDLDFMGARARIDDLALALFFAGLSLQAAPADLLARLADLVPAYDRALDTPLTDLEQAALPLAIARQPLFAAKWLAILDSEAAARRLASALSGEVAWAGQLLRDVGR